MADVFLAMVTGPEGSGFSKLEVVKRLRQNLAEDPDFVSMLLDEARISARLNHPNVVQLFEVGVVGESYYLAMEYLEGQPLYRVQQRARVASAEWPLGSQLRIVADVLAGLHHAHELADYDGSPLNVVHRDINPQNVFLTYGGHVKVVDFGIAKAAGRANETRQGIVKGKLRYMAPEQAMGAAIDRRADVFAAGLLLWEAIIGTRYWGNKPENEIATALIAGRFVASPRAVKPDVPEDLDRICVTALAHAPHGRYPTADAFKGDLDAYIAAAEISGERTELGAFVGRLFAKERALLKAIVERAGRHAAPVNIETLQSSRSSSSEHAGLGFSIRPTRIDDDDEDLAEVAPLPVLSTSPVPAAPRRKKSWIVGVAVAAAAVLAVAATTRVVVGSGVGGVEVSFEPRTKAIEARATMAQNRDVLQGAIGSPAQDAPPPAAAAPSPPVAPPPAAAAPSPPVAPVAADTSPRPTRDPNELPQRGKRRKTALDDADPWKDLPPEPAPTRLPW